VSAHGGPLAFSNRLPLHQQLQQTGMPFIITQQQQPDAIIFIMQSQHAWIMSQQALSPDVHIIMQPSAVISHLHIPIIIPHVIIGMPFIIMQHDIIPPAVIIIMFCIIVHCILSSHIHMIFIPPSTFIIVILQRGVIIMFGIIPIPGIIIPPIPFMVPIEAPAIVPVIVVMVVSNIFKLKTTFRSRRLPHFPPYKPPFPTTQ
jgi:hypothetical protein